MIPDDHQFPDRADIVSSGQSTKAGPGPGNYFCYLMRVWYIRAAPRRRQSAKNY